MMVIYPLIPATATATVSSSKGREGIQRKRLFFFSSSYQAITPPYLPPSLKQSKPQHQHQQGAPQITSKHKKL
jgi:hypothetical protein